MKHPGPVQLVVTGTVKGSSAVTPNGPLMPNPALGESSLKNSPRSKYRPKPARTTTFLRAGTPCDADARCRTPLPAGKRRVTDAQTRLGAAEFFVVSGDDQADVVDGVGAEIVGVVLRVEIGQQAVLLAKRAIPIPAQARDDGEIGFELEAVLGEKPRLFRAIVAVGLAIQESAAVPSAQVSGQEILESWRKLKVATSFSRLRMLSWP